MNRRDLLKMMSIGGLCSITGIKAVLAGPKPGMDIAIRGGSPSGKSVLVRLIKNRSGSVLKAGRLVQINTQKNEAYGHAGGTLLGKNLGACQGDIQPGDTGPVMIRGMVMLGLCDGDTA